MFRIGKVDNVSESGRLAMLGWIGVLSIVDSARSVPSHGSATGVYATGGKNAPSD